MTRFFGFIVARRGLILALAALLAIGGAINLSGLSIDAVPDISPKQVMILTEAKGLGPLEGGAPRDLPRSRTPWPASRT